MGARALQDVVLEDGGPVPLPADHSKAPADDLPRRIPRWWWVVGAGLALVVAVGTVLTDRREDARLAALADVPGVLAPLAGPVAELWRTDGVQYDDLTGFAGQLLGVGYRDDGSVAAASLDPGTGAVRWQVSLGPRSEGQVDCALPVEADRAVVACVVAGPTGTASSRLLVLDAASGEMVADTPTDPSTRVFAFGSDLLVQRYDAEVGLRLTRTDPRTSIDRWTVVTAAPAGGAATDPSIQVVGDRIVVTIRGNGTLDGAGGSVVVSADGAIVHSWQADVLTGSHGQIDALAGGLLAEPSTTSSSTTILDLGAGTSFTTQAHPVTAVPDDGSLGKVLLASRTGDALLAYDTASGQRLWTDPGALRSTPIVIDRRVVRTNGGELRSIDALTGQTVWTTPVPRATDLTVLTDGQVALLTRQDGAGVVLAAYGLDDGRLRWETAIPADLELTVIDGALYGRSIGATVAFGEAPA